MLWFTGWTFPTRRLRAVTMALLLTAAGPATAIAGEGAGLLGAGDAVVTGFSGTLPPPEGLPDGADPLDFTLIDPDGASMQVQRFLPAGPPAGQLIDAPALVTAPARSVGQVFAVTLDDAPAPNIYLGASSAFGIHIVAPGDDGTPRHVKQGTPGARFMDGQWGAEKGGSPGSIYRMDGITGEITLFTTIGANAGPGLGDVVFDRATRQFFASDLDTGLIYRLDSTGIIGDTFDHGTDARPGKGLPPVADDGSRMDISNPAFNTEDPATWGLTPEGRRVGGMAVHGGRLYYAVAEGPQVWSVGIELDGSFRADARWELDVAGLASSNPVTDIVFDGSGRMILAQRGTQRGSFDYSVFAEPKTSSVVRYTREVPDDPATPGTWVPVPEEYAVGFRPDQRNTDGGVALGYGYDATGAMRGGSCNAFLWTTGEALRDDPALAAQLSAGGPATVDGLQGNDASLVKPANAPPFSSYFTDYDGNFDHPERQGWMGDVEIYQPCDGAQGYLGYPGYQPPPFYFPPGYEPPPSGSFNLTLDKEATPGLCLPGGLGWLCSYTIRVTNTGSVPYWGPVTVRDWMPMAVPGALVRFDFQPPWLCAELGAFNYECTLPGAFLWPGDSVDLFVTVEQPLAAIGPREVVNGNICYAGNGAEIFWWGDYGDANPWDDVDYAEAQIPDEDCLPQGDGTNLTIAKTALSDPCVLEGDGWNCAFLITVTNTGPGIYNGPISVADELSVDGVINYGPQPDWNCLAGGGGSYACSHAPVSLNPGESIPLWFSVRINAREQQAANRCSIINRVRITDAPGGSPGNLNAGDDEAKAEAQTPGPNCVPETGRKSDLSITKEPKGCEYTAGVGGFACAYQVIVKNEGPDDFAGVVTVHDEPAGAAAAPMFVAPWACVPAGAGFDCSLDLSAAPLAAGESRPLNMAMMVSLNSQVCEVSNQASIKAPAGGTDANSNPGNDASGIVTQAVPLPACNPPQAPQSNLVISKTGMDCALASPNLTAVVAPPSGVTCRYQVTVQNAGPGDVNEAVTFSDTPVVDGVTAVTPSGGQAGWTCSDPAQTVTCSNPAGLPAGAASTFDVVVGTSRDMVRANDCKVINRAAISQPLGGPLNGNAADDVAEAIVNGPVNICTNVLDQKINACPTERQMPDQGCCPEGQKWNGKSCSGGVTPPKVCPSGTTGQYPDCRKITTKVCPSGTTGTYPDCRKITTKQCPSGTTGKYPDCRKITTRQCPGDSVGKYPNCECRKGTYGEPGNCRRKQCPKGTTGTWPDCRTVERNCPTGTHGKWPNCEPNICPKGTVGKWPDCTKPKRCPQGTSGKWPNCVPNVCPQGTYGQWPDCYKPGGGDTPKKCPKGTYGNYPNCKRISTGSTPNTNCPDGYVFSEKVKTCVQKKNKKRKQQEQPQQQQPLLQSPTMKIDPNLLQQQ